jgi:EAL domain-containing protein (putative c-di-GMP-specific phosphodiesterase class I)
VFIALAEETGLILPLGQWVLEAACAQLALWAMQPDMAHLTVAVNVSARQFHHKDFVNQVLAVLQRTAAKPSRLKLELTESLLVSNVEEIIAKMHILKAQGLGFSLDDFGTGYSSLSYLNSLPFDTLKIDQSFVRDMLEDKGDRAIVQGIIALAKAFERQTIAEGIETESHYQMLIDLGCELGQGYGIAKPMPACEIINWMSTYGKH